MTPPTGIVTINGRDISDLGLYALDLSDWWSQARASRRQATPAGLMGTLPGTVTAYEPRRIPMELLLSAGRSTRVGLLDEFRRATRGLLEVAVGDDTDRVAYGILEGDTASVLVPQAWHVGDLRIRLDLVCYDAAKYDRRGRVLSLPVDTRVEVEAGTAPHHGVVTIYGPATTPELRYRPHGGAATVTMTFATLLSDEAYEVDLGAQTLTKIDSGVRTDDLADGLTSSGSDGWFFAMDDADEPHLELTGGSGVLHYRRRWLS